MEMDAKRVGILKKINLFHYITAVFVVLIFAQWFMPYFQYEPTGKKDTKTQTSMWGEILFTYNFTQLETVIANDKDPALKWKHITLHELGAPVLMLALGIITLCTIGKKSLPFNIFPLAMGICGVKGWFFGSLIPQYCNVPVSKILGGVLAILLLISTIIDIIFCFQEIKSRPADFYLPALGG